MTLYKKIMVLSEHEWIFMFELSILRFFYGGNLTVIFSSSPTFSVTSQITGCCFWFCWTHLYSVTLLEW